MTCVGLKEINPVKMLNAAKSTAEELSGLVFQSRSYLEHRSVAGSASAGSAVQVALTVPYYARIRITAICVATGEVVKHGHLSGWSQLEHRPPAESAMEDRSAIEVALDVHHPSSVGRGPVPARPSEAIQHRLLSGRIQFEHCPAIRSAASWSRAVEVALAVHHHSSVGGSPVPTRTGEAVQDSFLASRVQFEHCSMAGSSTARGCAVQIALGIH